MSTTEKLLLFVFVVWFLDLIRVLIVAVLRRLRGRR